MNMPLEKHTLRYRRFLAPRYWLIWILFGWMRVAALLPYPWQINIGKYFGRIGFYVARKTRYTVTKNIETCFPNLSKTEKYALLIKHFEAVGAAFSEMGLGWFSSTNRLLKLVKVEGLEHVERAQEKGKGIIILAAHFTTLETSTSILGEYFPRMKSIYRPQPNAMIDALIYRGRRRQVDEQIPNDNIRAMVRALRNNGSVCYLADLANKGSSSELIPFFGVPAVTTTTVSKLAKITGATVLTYFFRRLPGEEGYVANIGAPLNDFPTDDVIADTSRLVKNLEDYILLAPEQYMWTYRRFKGRPGHYPDIYRPEL
jgi:Kdo2-lipid IVA lauroyltransferase/acyltransferase